MQKKNGAYILRGHFNGTPRERDQHLTIPPADLAWAEKAANQYLATGALPLAVGAPTTHYNTSLTPADLANLLNACTTYQNSIPEGGAPRDFWSLYLVNQDGGPVDWQDATHACFEVYNFDGLHDFDWLNDLLNKANIAIPCIDLEYTGEGETQWGRCPICGYDLTLDKK